LLIISIHLFWWIGTIRYVSAFSHIFLVHLCNLQYFIDLLTYDTSTIIILQHYDSYFVHINIHIIIYDIFGNSANVNGLSIKNQELINQLDSLMNENLNFYSKIKNLRNELKEKSLLIESLNCSENESSLNTSNMSISSQ
jgi:hypothetical protein